MGLIFSVNVDKIEEGKVIKDLFVDLYSTNILISNNLSFRKYIRAEKIRRLLENNKIYNSIDISDYLTVYIIKPF